MTCEHCHEYRKQQRSNYCGNCGDAVQDNCHACKQALDSMTFSEYQELSERTAKGMAEPRVESEEDMKTKAMFLALALNGEAGEFGEKIKKYVREGDAEYLEGARAELGDVLWYMAQLATLLNVDLEDVAEDNLDKLFDRQDRGVLHDEGDNR